MLTDVSNSPRKEFVVYRAQNLEGKLLKYFGDELIIRTIEGCEKKIVHKANISVEKLLLAAAIHSNDDFTRREDVALELREAAISITTRHQRPLPKKLYPSDVIGGECDIPEEIYDFISLMIKGRDVRRQKSTSDNRRINAVCSDIIFNITKGRIKPSKHLILGISIKSGVGGRKLLSVLNRYGHCISYTKAEELETEMAYTAYNNNRLIPPGIKIARNLSTHLAFDNNDRFVETDNGKDTLHDTVAIIIQTIDELADVPGAMEANNNIVPSVPISGLTIDSDNSPNSTDKFRRSFNAIPMDLQPYHGKPTAKTTLIPLENVLGVIRECQESKIRAIVKDIVWAMSLFHSPSTTPMWIGFNCRISKDDSPMQVVDYLPQINASPTSYTVVLATLRMSLQVGRETGQVKVIVTFDLAIAKMAMQLQISHRPEFDDIFINMGSFHIMFAHFAVCGKKIDGCGLTDILRIAGVLADGSVNGFIGAKHFNRCKRIHPLLAAALQRKHMEQFAEQHDWDLEEFLDELNHMEENPVDSKDSLNLSPTLQESVNKYHDFTQETLSGKHGKTAQFYLQYVEMVRLYLRFSRSIRTNDIELFIDSLWDMVDFFFIYNQPNYARWTLKFLSNLIDEKNEGSYFWEELSKCGLGVKRTKNKFSRSPVDLTLEQTINADSADGLKGISHFTNSIGARQRWAYTHAIRTKIISTLLLNVGLTRQDDVTPELRKSRMEKDRKAVDSIIQALEETMNPFDSSLNADKLFNVATGRAMSEETSNYLLADVEAGRRQKEQFLNECRDDVERFERPIKRNKMLNCAAECVKKVVLSKDGKEKVLIQQERDVFGRLLLIAINYKIDLKICFSYPLAPVPPALCHVTGEMHKTNKAVFANRLISLNHEPCLNINPTHDIIDGFYFLRLLGKTLPATYGEFAAFLLRKLCNTEADEIHVIFDRYFQQSIKDYERRNRQEVNQEFAITGAEQRMPPDFMKSLQNIKFKEALVVFLVQNWHNDALVPILKEKMVYVTCEEKCFSFRCDNNRMVKLEEENFECHHEEADTRITFHLNKLPTASIVVIHSCDTDVLIILLANLDFFDEHSIYMRRKTQKGPDYTLINVNKIAENMDPMVRRALPAFHAFTGSDYTAAFYKKGKMRPFKLLKSNVAYAYTFANLSMDSLDDELYVKELEKFVCAMYGGKREEDSVNLFRLNTFQNLYSVTPAGTFESSVKNFDSSLIPPCWNVLRHKILRTIYVTSMWKRAVHKNCYSDELKVENCGWVMTETGETEPLWYEGDPTPMNVNQIILSNDDEEFEVNREMEQTVDEYEESESENSDEDE